MLRKLLNKIKKLTSPQVKTSEGTQEFSDSEKADSNHSDLVPPSGIDEATAVETVATWNVLNPP